MEKTGKDPAGDLIRIVAGFFRRKAVRAAVRRAVRANAVFLTVILLSACAETAAETDREGAAGRAEALAEQTICNFRQRELLGKLRPELLRDFVCLYQCTEQFEEKCVLPTPVSAEEAELLMILLHTECPELFQQDCSKTYSYEIVDEKVVSLSVPYSMERAEYEERLALCRQRIGELAERARTFVNVYDREMSVYQSICELADYDKELSHAADASGVLIEGKGKCDGISLSFKWVMEELEIPCMVITGDSRNPGNPLGHAWNLVKPGNAWRTVDVTQDCSRENRSSLLYPLYNSSDTWLLREYETPEMIRDLGIPSCTGTEESYHVLNGSYFTGTEAKTGFLQTLERANREGGSAQIQYETQAAWEDFQQNADSWTGTWMQEKGLYGEWAFTFVDAFFVAQVDLMINDNSASLKALEKQITGLYSRLEEEQEQLEEKGTALENLYGQMEGIRAEAESMSAAGLTDAASIDRYNALVTQYNQMLDMYNTGAENYETARNQYEDLLEEYNEIVRTYNEMAAQ